MILMKKQYKEPHEFFIQHLKIINPFLPVELNKRELEVLGVFMSFKGEIAEEDRFCTSLRKEVMKVLGFKNEGGLGNHLKSLKDKGFILEGLTGKLMIREFLFPKSEEQDYQFKIILNNEKSSTDL